MEWMGYGRGTQRAISVECSSMGGTDQRTKDYVARRVADGHSKLDAIRALKRYLAREVFTLITQRRREINATQIAARQTEGRPRFAVCRSGLSGSLASLRSRRFDGAARKPLRQRQGRELHEDPQGRSRLPDGLRNLRRRRPGPSAVHRRSLQPTPSPLRPGLPQPAAVR